MSLENLKTALPAYAKDLKLNLGSVIGGSQLSPLRLWGTVLATAIASRDPQTLRELDDEVRDNLSAEEYDAAKAAAAIMAMNNVFYRGKHLLHEAGVEGYSEVSAGLRMSAIGTQGGLGVAHKSDFEYWQFAVSAVNGCGQCLAAHETALRDEGVTKQEIHEALKIAAVVHGVAVTLEAEAILARV
jgi:alkyl hydroperoxide reductase subunit D